MIPKFNKVNNRFKLNGFHYNFNELKEVAYSLIKEGTPNEKSSGEFLIDWTDGSTTVAVETSGSTGKPKSIALSKQAMVHSAIATGDFFNLKPGDKALHCLPNDYIAGKMMIVRAIVLGLDLTIVAASSLPIFDYAEEYAFSAMVPLQLKNALPYIDNIKNLIVGGASISNDLMDKVQASKSHIFETYGMTETCTHIAIKQINHCHLDEGTTEESPFKALPNVSFSKDDRDCLIINAPHLEISNLVTNDIVELYNEQSFKLLGRFDNVINTGGVKVFPEKIETLLSGKIKNDFFISSIPDEDLGQKVILLIEGKEEKEIDRQLFDTLSKFEKPKEVFFIPKFNRSTSGKLLRKKTMAIAQL